MTTTDEVPMPEPEVLAAHRFHWPEEHKIVGYTADQLHAYADARCAALEAVIHERNQSLRKWADWCKEAEAERDSLAEDARRYRWLRARMDAGMVSMIVNIEPDDNDEISLQVQAAIDAAIGGDEA